MVKKTAGHNLFMVGCLGSSEINIGISRRLISKAEAINLAAWLVAVASVSDRDSDSAKDDFEAEFKAAMES